MKVNSASGTSVAELGVAQELGEGDVWSSGVSERHDDPGSVPRASVTKRKKANKPYTF